jgi:hypothetical protein
MTNSIKDNNKTDVLVDVMDAASRIVYVKIREKEIAICPDLLQ